MPTCSPPWEQKPGCASCSSCCQPIPKASLLAKSSTSSTYRTPRSLIIWTSSRRKAWSRSAVRAHSCTTPPTPERFRNFCNSSMPSAALVTKRLSRKPSSSFVDKGAAMSPEIKEVVKEKYAQAAQRVTTGGSSCCGAAPAQAACGDPITSNLYDAAQAGQIPEQALLASLGCGNPTALAELKPGETVLDLGSGGGIDVLLSARRVGPAGKAYGLDMTDEMLALANENKRRAGLNNVEFLKGEIEHVPLPVKSVDVIISNCVINLSAAQVQVLREALRVLYPVCRLTVSEL